MVQKGPKDLRKYLNEHGYIFSDPGTYQWPLTSPNVKGRFKNEEVSLWCLL